MSGPTRVLMISRRYWPHLAIDSACRDLQLADALRRGGTAIEVLTPRYASSWPDFITHREIPVHRPFNAPRGSWSMSRYLRQVQAWLGERAASYDVIYCTGLGEETPTVVEACANASRSPRGGPRCVLGHSGTGAAADHLTLGLRHGRRIRASLSRAASIVVAWPSAHRGILAAGVPEDRVRRIEIGIKPGSASSPGDEAGRRQAASKSRTALAEVNGDLALHRNSLVVLTLGRMNSHGGMATVARAAPSLADTWPDLRFWFIGDGPGRNELYGFFAGQNMRENMAMPGTFVDFEDLFRIADVAVLPSAADGLEAVLPAAVAAAVPLVVADSPDLRSFLGEGEETVLRFQEGNHTALAEAIRRALIDLPGRRDAAHRLRRELLRRRPYEQTVSRYRQLFESLASDAPPREKLPCI